MTRFAVLIAAIVGLVVGCTSDNMPALPASSDTAGIAERAKGPGGQDFLREITTATWDDDGRRAAELFAWIPRDASSADAASATRAGQTANAIGSFLADNRDALKAAPANSALWQSFSRSLVPYLGAMVGDDKGVAGFEPLDGIDSKMSRTTSVFAAMTKDAAANRTLTDGAAALAHDYEVAFANAAAADPVRPANEDALRGLFRAAYLRALVDAGRYLADPDSPRPSPRHAQLEVKYQFVSLTARPDDPHINAEFFKDGRLLPPSSIAKSDVSIYDSQLSTYLVDYPQISATVGDYGRKYDLVAG